MQYLILLTETLIKPTEELKTLQINDIISVVSVFVTITGFVITYRCLKKEYSLAIFKEKSLYATKEIQSALDLSYDLLWAYADYIFILGNSDKNNNKDKMSIVEKFQDLRDELRQLILKFGSLQSAKLWSYFEYNIQCMSSDKDFVQWTISILILIISQIKYDIYGIRISPMYIYLSIFPKKFQNDSNDLFLQKTREYNNNFVKLLELDNFLIIKNSTFPVKFTKER